MNIASKKVAPPDTLTAEELVARTQALLPAIKERIMAAEQARRQPDESIIDMINAGLARILLPKRWGGYELPFDTLVDVILEIASVDTSAGWCAAFVIVHPWFLALFPEQAQHDVWANNPDAQIATSLSPVGRFTRVDGGYQLSGNWAWSSGVDYSEWVIVTALPTTLDGPPIALLLARSQYQIQDTWHVAGLKASGSQNILVENVFVPQDYTVLLPTMQQGRGTPGSRLNTGPLYNLPMLSAFALALIAPILGTARGAYTVWNATLQQRFAALSPAEAATLTHQIIRLTEISSLLDDAELLIRKNLDIIRPGGPIETRTIVQNRRDYVRVKELCLEAVDIMYQSSGGSANYDSHPLQRFWRDIHAIAAHTALNSDNAKESYGRFQLGRPSNPHDILRF